MQLSKFFVERAHPWEPRIIAVAKIRPHKGGGRGVDKILAMFDAAQTDVPELQPEDVKVNIMGGHIYARDPLATIYEIEFPIDPAVARARGYQRLDIDGT